MSEVIDKPRARTVKAAKPGPALTIGAATDRMWKLREDKRALEAQVKVIETEMKELEGTVFGLLDGQDTRKAEGKSASVSINESVVANVENWDAFWPWLAKAKNFHLVQKRVSDPGMRELWALGKTIPGVQPFTKRTLAIRSL